MADIIEATEAATEIKATIDGKEYAFKRLTVYGRAELMRAERKRKREELKERLKEVGAAQAVTFNELCNFDGETVTDTQWIEFVNSPLGKYPVLSASLELIYPGQGETIAKACDLGVDEVFLLILPICGLALKPKAETSEAPALPPPTDPAVYGT